LIIGEEKVITGRPADLLEPTYDKMFEQAKLAGLASSEEDVLTYIMYPAIAPSFLKGERKAEAIPSSEPVAKASSTVPSQMEVEVDGEIFSIRILSVEGAQLGGKTKIEKIPRGEIVGGVKSNMQGMVLEVMTSRGAVVKKGDTLLVLEAMKMENPIHSTRDGVVTEIFVDAGDVVQNGDVLLVVE
jgi:pyruvate carboxylase subunit B